MHFFKKIILAVFFIVCSAFADGGLNLTKEEKSWLKKNSNIKLVALSDQPPLSMVDNNNKLVGIVPDIIKFLNMQIGQEIELFSTSSSNYHNNSKNKGVYGITAITNTKKHKDEYLITSPYLSSPYFIYTLKEREKFFKNNFDLKGKKVVVIKAHRSGEEFLEDIDGVDIIKVDSPLEQIQKVISGEADALLGFFTYQSIINKYLIADLTMAYVAKENQSIHIGINPEHKILHSILNKAIEKLTLQQIDQIMGKWTKGTKVKSKKLYFTIKEKEFLKNNPSITLSINDTTPPKSFIDKDGEIKGSTIDMVRLIEKKSGLKINLKGSIWATALEQAYNGEVDGVLHADALEERKKYLDFTEVYSQVPIILLAHHNEEKIEDLNSYCGRKVASVYKTSYTSYLESNFPCIDIVTYKNAEETLLALAKGEVDGTFGNYETLMGLSKLHSLHGLKTVFFKYLPPVGYACIGLKKGNPVLLGILNKAIDSISVEEKNTINTKWYGSELPHLNGELEQDKTILSKEEKKYLKSKNHTINICTRINHYPLDSVKEGKHVGIFGEYLKLVSDRLNVEFNLVSSDSLKDIKTFIKEKKCDILSGMPTNQKYMEQLIPSEPFYDTSLVVIGNIEKRFIRDMEFEKDDKIVVFQRFYYDYIKKFYPDLEVEIEDSYEKVFEKVISDENYVTVILNDIADRFILEYGYKKLKIIGYFGHDKKVFVSMGVDKDETILLGIMNKVIKTIPKDNIKEIQKHYQLTRYHESVDYSLLWWIIGIFLVLIFLAILRVITLRRDNRKLHELIDTTIGGIAIFENGRLVDCNSQLLKMFRVDSFDKIKGFSAYEFIDKKEHGVLKERLQEDQKPYEYTGRRIDGTLFPILVKGTIISGNKRVSSVIDITELKNIQDELEYLNKTLEARIQNELDKNKKQQAVMLQQSRLAQMGEMISMIAHQWRQPINNIYSMIQTIALKHKKGKLDEDLMGEFKSSATRQIYFMSNTIDDFKNFFKPAKEKEVFELCETLDSTISLFKPIIADTSIEFNIDCEKGISVNGFPNELGQVILNLLNNAKDALLQKTDDKKWINLSINRDGESVYISISDNAGGIKEEIIGKVFDPYFSTKSDKNGTGLGLYMSKIIIEDHMGGELKIENKDSGLFVSIELNIIKED